MLALKVFGFLLAYSEFCMFPVFVEESTSMSNPLTLADVERVAALAHLELTDAEKHTFLEQLNEILGYAQQIQKVDTTGVAPTAHVASRHSADRTDELRPSLPVIEALAAAPEPALQAGLFKVPRVLGGIE